MKKNTTTTEVLLSKLRQPLHITYICEHILKTNISDCRSKINSLVEDGLVKESEYGKDYFVVNK
jgi:hypothetical protein